MSHRHPYDPFSCAGLLTGAKRRGEPSDVIEVLRARLYTGKAKVALDRTLADAPPLTAAQVEFLHAVVDGFGQQPRDVQPDFAEVVG